MTSKSVQKILTNYEIKYTFEKEKSKEKVNFIYVESKTKIRGSIFIDIFNYYISDLCFNHEEEIKTIPKLNAFLSLVPMLKAAYEQNKEFQNDYTFEPFWKGQHHNLLTDIHELYSNKLNLNNNENLKYLGIICDSRWLRSRETYNKEDIENARKYFNKMRKNLLRIYKPQSVKNIISFIDLNEIFFNQTEYLIKENEEIEIEEIEDF